MLASSSNCTGHIARQISALFHQFNNQERKGLLFISYETFGLIFIHECYSSLCVGRINKTETNFGSDISCTTSERQYAKKRHFY